MSALRAMGMQISISSLAGGGTELKLTCGSGNFSDDQIESLIGQIATLNRPDDLGFRKEWI